MINILVQVQSGPYLENYRQYQTANTSLIELKRILFYNDNELDRYIFRISDEYKNLIDVKDESQTLASLKIKSGDTIYLYRKEDQNNINNQNINQNQIAVYNQENSVVTNNMNSSIDALKIQIVEKDQINAELAQQIAQLTARLNTLENQINNSDTFTPLPISIKIGAGTEVINLQEQLPIQAKVIAVFIKSDSGGGNKEYNTTWTFSTQKGSLVTYCHPYNQNAWNSCTDNCTLALDQTRTITVLRNGHFPNGNFSLSFNIKCYR